MDSVDSPHCVRHPPATPGRARIHVTGPTRGFTLVEVLVAIAILALVALLAWRATAAMTDSETRLNEESVRWQRLDALLTRVEADLRAAVPRRARHGNAVEPPWSLSTADAAGNAVLIFTRAGPSSIDEPGVGGQRVGYQWRAGRIDALYWPQLDTPGATDPATFALADQITRFRVLALGSDGRWSSEWPVRGGSELPRAVRVEVALADGSTIERWLALQ
jgi:general secretion pathway protein J